MALSFKFVDALLVKKSYACFNQPAAMTKLQPCSQGLSSSSPLEGGKMRDPGNEVAVTLNMRIFPSPIGYYVRCTSNLQLLGSEY